MTAIRQVDVPLATRGTVRSPRPHRLLAGVGVTWFLLGLVLVWVAGESRTSYFTQGCDGWWAWYPALMIAAAGSWLVSGILDAVAAYRAPRRGAQVSLAVLAVLALGLAMLFVTGMVGVLIAVADFSAGC